MAGLERLTERIWFFPFEQERDRPNLGYIRGDRWSLAVDAGHSAAHTAEFYRALEARGLPLPSLTVLTHWHWDHTLGMHAVHGLCLACGRTNAHLLALRERLEKEGREAIVSLHESVAREYAGDREIVVAPADLIFAGDMHLDAGNCPVRLFQARSPHTDDAVLICAEKEKTLFVGDALCGAFPDWKKDPGERDRLRKVIEESDAEIFLEGHWTPEGKRETVECLMADE